VSTNEEVASVRRTEEIAAARKGVTVKFYRLLNTLERRKAMLAAEQKAVDALYEKVRDTCPHLRLAHGDYVQRYGSTWPPRTVCLDCGVVEVDWEMHTLTFTGGLWFQKENFDLSIGRRSGRIPVVTKVDNDDVSELAHGPYKNVKEQ
jgi:hypothetical protein